MEQALVYHETGVSQTIIVWINFVWWTQATSA